MEQLDTWGPQGTEAKRVFGYLEGVPVELIWWSRELAPGERVALVQRLLDDATRVLRIVYALNRVWEPTTKRLGDRVRDLPMKPGRLAERIEEALTEPNPARAALAMNELQLETVELAPSGPNVDRARVWLSDVVEVLRDASRTAS